jgi:AcrR family transcriptional regulator
MARPQSDVSERIVRAARERFLQQGVDGASLRQIASDAGTNIGMVYYYFKTKDDLFLAVVEEVYARFVTDITAVLDPSRSVHERIEQLYARVAAMSEDELHMLQLVFREALVSSERLQRVALRFQKGHFPLLARVVRDGMQDGSLRNDVHPIALMAGTFMLGLIPQLAHRRITASGLPFASALPDTQATARAMLEVALHGVAGPHSRK